MNGYRTTIFEMRDKPGGLCTSWMKKGFTFDYTIHNLAGTVKSSSTHRIWDELGALQNTEIINHEELVRVESPDGRTFTVYSDLDRLVDEMKRLSPTDVGVIDEYAKAVRSFSRIDLFNLPLGGLKRKIGMLLHLRAMLKYTKVTMREFATRFSDPFLSMAFPLIQYDSPDAPMMVNLAFMAGLDSGDMGWPVGGSLRFVRNIEERFFELGGVIDYKTRVSKIIVKGNKAVGVRLIDGSEYFADIVISAADGSNTIFEMLGGEYSNEMINTYYQKEWPLTQQFGQQVAFGVKRDLTDEPHSIVLMLDRPITIEGSERTVLDLELFSEASGLAPPGKGIIKVVLKSDYDFWKKSRTEGQYLAKKVENAKAIIERLEARFTGLSGEIEAVDLSTPLTVERYTGNFRGLQAWMPREGMSRVLRKGLSRTLPGLDNFYMAGQWSMATIGLNTAAISGRKTIQKICKEDKRRFVTSIKGYHHNGREGQHNSLSADAERGFIRKWASDLDGVR